MTGRLIQNQFGARLPHIARGDGVWLIDTDGRRYLDGCSGAVVASIGHGHPDVVAAIRAQAGRITYTHRGFFTDHTLEELADGLTDWTGYAGAWFVNSGSEAVEAAMQFALQYHRERGQPERTEFSSFTRGYHGNTLGGLSLSGHVRRAVVGGLAWPFAELPVPYRSPGGAPLAEAEFTARLLAGARAVLERRAERLAGVVVEPVGGATLGATVPPAGYLAGLCELCPRVRRVADHRRGDERAGPHRPAAGRRALGGDRGHRRGRQGARCRLHPDRRHLGRLCGAGGHRRRAPG